MPFSRLLPQPLVGIATVTLAVSSLLASLLVSLPALFTVLAPETALLALGLMSAIVLGHRFPIHIGRSTKVYVNTVPLYLIAVLLAPSAAAVVAGVGILAGEIVVRKKQGTYNSDIATAAGRLSIVVLLASIVDHLLLAGSSQALTLGLTAAILWVGDVLTLPLVIAPMCNERPLAVMASYLRQSSVVEWVQYLLGIAGALAAFQAPWTLALFALPIVAIHQHFKRLKEMHERTRHLLERIADTVDDHDAYTGGHSRRVTAYTARLVQALAVDHVEAALIVMAARIHDIGKIDIPASILQKPGKLTDDERAIIETHPDRGADMLQNYPDFRRGADMVRYHHEAWNGSGYPRGLRGTSIPFGARVIAVADSYDAMTSDRPYRKGLASEVAAKELRRGRGVQWDPEIVDAFLHVLPDLAAHPTVPYLRLVEHDDRESLPLAQ
ncbi:MAG TPA: HD-GYP domain-containing protein [Chloroflexota bacterium]|nr:HD-GYP domain-containing protein [Chloroflexota bacterium]